ncbi:threonine synthase [Natroniella sulfidigena]|uniref:threonine synthase n=1 Tax=Natroniella sulfidigena TaxID=723921 RepID=UPI00200B82BB|nr:threonine synthase [Natroniella sulfidigena]MCK8817217.1 threonine synthase [Natroniella sulfidigena]
MKYVSTRGNYQPVSAAEAIRLGMVPTGGLFVPEKIPTFSKEKLTELVGKSYQDIAQQILAEFLTDYTAKELEEVVNAAYNETNFATEEIAPYVKLDEQSYVLELWHGPTAAFKDMALQLMPHLLVKAIEKVDLDKEIVILVATSGDTGKAALEGFKDVEGIKIIVFYPAGGVSKVQEQQMVTTTGTNTSVVAVEGNFDDCQSSVKEIFGDQGFKELLEEHDYQFSSANSINWGRLVPQIIYYFASYASLVADGQLEVGEQINISVPTGNFGNILAAYYAYRMGLPVNKFICASNDNKVLTDFLQTGVYDSNRDFKRTISPSMDILISSNLERFLFEMTDHDAAKIEEWYQDLEQTGKFEIGQAVQEQIKELFVGEYATEEETVKTIKQIYESKDYVVDTHTAVGIKAYQKYLADYDDPTLTVIDSTANPYKFSAAVLEAVQGELETEDEFEILSQLEELTGLEIHRGLRDLEEKEVRHDRGCQTTEIKDEVKDILGLR